MDIRIVAVCVAILSITGCASNTNVAKSDQAPTTKSLRDDGYRCEREVVTGSRFPIKRCTTAYQRHREAEEAKEAMSRMRSGTGQPINE